MHHFKVNKIIYADKDVFLSLVLCGSFVQISPFLSVANMCQFALAICLWLYPCCCLIPFNP